MTIIFAHRGASKQCPENTMSAFKRAVELGAGGIELDIQLSSDHVPVVIHDRTLKRTASGRSIVTETSFSDLRKHDAGSWFSPSFKGEVIPSLEEVLIFANEFPDLWLNIELKYYSDTNTELVEKSVPLIKKHRSEKNTVISSFAHNRLVDVHKLWSKVETAPIYKANLEEPWDYAKQIKAKAIHPQFRAVNRALTKASQAHGINVRPYTINDERLIKQFLEWEADGIITDVPDVALKIMKNEHIPQERRKWWKVLWQYIVR
ncbi:glycerophosphodiester phosphodiesterase [Alkalihalobacillus sp. CinArs1]|uniref:glycerophosphodiester phosphodiesterase n=1 Tax=Alkalihalobacillus sp. CinArs1 TaxID=2995314 RepID=UPI0022DD386F|nr:glycerophosphodiester phosphodiesterase family protein [Alkalihalobacillus sp. CinArs1]